MSLAKNWCFTLNNPTDAEQQHLESTANPLIAYIVFQLEEGENATRHLQGYVQLTARKRIAQVKTLLTERCHLEVSRGSAEDNQKYCTKEPRLGGPWQRGTISGKGKRNDIRKFVEALQERDLTNADLHDEFADVLARYPRFVTSSLKEKKDRSVVRHPLIARPGWQTGLLDYLHGEPHDRKIRWYVDAVGSTGKSTFARRYDAKRSYLVTGGKHTDIYYGYDFEPVVFFDLARTAEDKVPWEVMENMKNGYFLSTKYEVKRMRFDIPHVIVFSNFNPDRTKFSQDRWDVHIINENPL